MKNKINLLYIFGFIVIILFGCNKPRNQMFFSNIDSVQVAIKELDTILYKLPKAEGYKLRYYQVKGNVLVLNNIRINSIVNLSPNDFKIPEISNYLSEQEKMKLCDNIIFLHKNKISNAMQGESFWQFRYYYKSHLSSDYATYRMIIAVYNPIDTSSAYFKWSNEILDSQNELVLYKDITENKNLNESPPYPPRINPYTNAPAQ